MDALHAVALETEAEKEQFNRLLDDGHYLALRIQRKTSTPALRENFGRRPSLALRILMRPFDASVDF